MADIDSDCGMRIADCGIFFLRLSHYLFFLAVLIEETAIASISSASFIKSLKESTIE